MYLSQADTRAPFAEMIKQLKIDQILNYNPEMVMKPKAIAKRLEYTPDLFGTLGDGVRVRLVDAKKQEPRNYWYNQIGHTFRLYSNSYSVGGMGMVDSRSGCHTMNSDDNGLVFELFSLPINTIRN